MILTQSPLGKTSTYQDQYNPTLLFPISRQLKRDEIHIAHPLPFHGSDLWNAYEISWLNKKGKPEVATAQFSFPCESPFIVESKSFKLYLNSFNQTRFASLAEVILLLKKDLSSLTGADVDVALFELHSPPHSILTALPGFCLDQLDIECDTYEVNPDYLQTESYETTETLSSHLLKSNCLVTGQPDWGSIQIRYTGKKIQHENLLKYLISFRNHNEFHEQCVERIFMDIQNQCKPQALSVLACYTRRGGLDINPYRSTATDVAPSLRLCRQ